MIPEEDKKKLRIIISEIDNFKGEDISIIDMRELPLLTDYVVIVTCSSAKHMEAAAAGVVFALKRENYQIDHQEGSGEASWFLLDYHDIVINMFYPDSRAFYNLDKLYNNAPKILLSDVNGEGNA